LELDLELSVGPDEETIDGVLALQPPKLRVDDLAVAEIDRRAAAFAGKVDNTRFSTDLDSLNEIDHRHVGELAGELGLRLPFLGQRRALLLLKQDLHARDDLLDVDRLGQVLLDAELEAADLVLDGLGAGEEDERDLVPLRPLLQALTQAEPIELRHP